MRLWILGIVTSATSVLAVPSYAATRYQITDLGVFPTAGSQVFSSATSINDSGQIVGDSTGTDGIYTHEHAFIYQDGVMEHLGTAPGQSTDAFYAQSISQNGLIAGYGAGGYYGGYLWAHGSWTLLPGLDAFPTLVHTHAQGVNNAGQVVGYVADFYTEGRAFLFQNGSMTDLGTLGGLHSYAYGINNKGQIVGEADLQTGYIQAFLYESGKMINLGTLGGTRSRANAINDSGVAAGFSFTTGDTGMDAALFSGGTVIDLGTLGGNYSEALSINNHGVAVGASRLPGGSMDRAVLFENDKPLDLNDLIDPQSGWTLNGATSINNLGQIVGNGVNPAGETHAFLLTPTPEPSCACLIAFTTAGLLIRPRRAS